MGHYRFSEGAAHDFDQIYDFGIDEFGLDQATKYQNRLKQRFSELADTPLLYPAVEHIREGYRRSVCGVQPDRGARRCNRAYLRPTRPKKSFEVRQVKIKRIVSNVET